MLQAQSNNHMYKLLFVSLSLLISSVGFSAQESDNQLNNSKIKNSNSNIVWICTSPNAYTYHSKEFCSTCSYERKKITKSEAEKMGRRACKKCARYSLSPIALN